MVVSLELLVRKGKRLEKITLSLANGAPLVQPSSLASSTDVGRVLGLCFARAWGLFQQKLWLGIYIVHFILTAYHIHKLRRGLPPLSSPHVLKLETCDHHLERTSPDGPRPSSTPTRLNWSDNFPVLRNGYTSALLLLFRMPISQFRRSRAAYTWKSRGSLGTV